MQNLHVKSGCNRSLPTVHTHVSVTNSKEHDAARNLGFSTVETYVRATYGATRWWLGDPRAVEAMINVHF